MKNRGKRILVPAAVAALVAMTLVGRWYRESAPRNFAVVTPGVLYRCGQGHPFQFDHVIERYGIRTIVCLRKVAGLEAEQRLARTRGVTFVYRPIDDTDRPVPEDVYLDFLRRVQDPAQRPVLVHCAMGCHRTGTFVAIYRMVVEGWPRDKAMKEMESFGFDLNTHTILIETLKKIDVEKVREKLRGGMGNSYYPCPSLPNEAKTRAIGIAHATPCFRIAVGFGGMVA